jgi:hypothetical protein
MTAYGFKIFGLKYVAALITNLRNAKSSVV